MINLMQGDCLELMKTIPDGSVDMILTDPPYGTVKGAALDGWKSQTTEWDNVLDFELMWSEINRILRKNGKCILFSQEPFTSDLIKSAIPNVPFSYRCIWIKDHFANSLIAKKAPVNYFEDICVFSKMNDIELAHPIRNWLKETQERVGIFWNDSKLHEAYLKSGIAKNIQSAKVICQHKLDWNYAQIQEINERHYDLLDSFYNFDKTKEELKEIYNQYKNDFASTFNLPKGSKYKSNVFEYKKDYDGYHPTQKPVALLEDLIKTYSNEGDTVLDFTMGSGSTGVAAKNTNRKFIGIELDETYFKIAQDRIK